jgi:hypothetical protein
MRLLQRRYDFTYAFGSAMLYQYYKPLSRVAQRYMKATFGGPSTVSKRCFTEETFPGNSPFPYRILPETDFDAFLRTTETSIWRGVMLSRRTSGEKKKKWTETETKIIKELLEKGSQMWEVAQHLGRPREQVRKKIKGDEKLRDLLKPVKSGRWSKEEIEYLMRLRIEGFNRSVLAKRLGRSKESVASKIAEKSEQIRSLTMLPTFQGPQALSPGLTESIFQARLRESWDCLMRSKMTEDWKGVLSQASAESWLWAISENTSSQIKQLLASHRPPTAVELAALPWTETSNAGVYAWILNPRSKFHLDKEVHLYVGSASRYGSGLEGRKHQHLSESTFMHNRRLRSLIKRRKLGRQGHFLTLMTLEFESEDKDDVLKARHLVTVAESIFTMWLGAFTETMEDGCGLRDHCPWGRNLPYSGLSSHNPLTKDVVVPKDVSDTTETEGSDGVQEDGMPNLLQHDNTIS